MANSATFLWGLGRQEVRLRALILQSVHRIVDTRCAIQRASQLQKSISPLNFLFLIYKNSAGTKSLFRSVGGFVQVIGEIAAMEDRFSPFSDDTSAEDIWLELLQVCCCLFF